ncbi:MAG: nucleotidyltransferase domain-containing protein [Schleiferiaceae bacterium]|jgi:hypothetical protein|nr:nucleotidyltransferase domain-containing protein [Schleiferiaceae bacterium]
MPILATALYGSRARGDHSASSDTDLFLITDNDAIKHDAVGGLSSSYYPLHRVKEMAEGGNLFLYHVLHEGIILYDPKQIFETLKNDFCFLDSYQHVATEAAAIGWMIVNHPNHAAQSPILRRRIAWCVRTILIAQSANRRSPVFSRDQLCKISSSIHVSSLIQQKDQKSNLAGTAIEFEYLEDFLVSTGISNPVSSPINLASYKAYFEKFNVSIGLDFLSSFDSSHVSEIYL